MFNLLHPVTIADKINGKVWKRDNYGKVWKRDNYGR